MSKPAFNADDDSLSLVCGSKVSGVKFVKSVSNDRFALVVYGGLVV